MPDLLIGRNRFIASLVSVGLPLFGLSVAGASADFDSVSVVYDVPPVPAVIPNDPNAILGQLGGFGFNPNTQQLYVAIIGADQGLFRIENVGSATQSDTRLATATQYQTFTYGKQPVPFGLALNPVAFNGSAAYSVAYLMDAHAAGTTGDYTTTNRLYSWNLGDLSSTGALKSALSGYQIDSGAGVATTNNPAVVRQPRYGNDGKSLYFSVGAGTAGGIYRYDATTGGVSRFSTATATATQEIGIQSVSASTDRILYTDGAGNVVYSNYNSTTGVFGAQQTLLSAATINTFIRGTTGVNYSVNSVTSDSDGNVYLQVGIASQNRNVLLRYDTQGRLAKETTLSELRTLRPGMTVTMSDTQVVAGTYTGTNGTINVNQFYFGNNSNAASFIGKVNLFQPGDFNRDGVVNSADAALLRAPGVLKTVGTTTTDSNLFKFDLNGDAPAPNGTVTALTSVVDYYDVKAFQKFFNFADGDTDFSQTLDTNDLNTIRDNYGSAAAVWTQGDFNGDNTVNLADLQIFANSWLNVLHQPNLTEAQLNQLGYTGQFLSDVETAFAIPEPMGLSALVLAAGLLGRRREH